MVSRIAKNASSLPASTRIATRSTAPLCCNDTAYDPNHAKHIIDASAPNTIMPPMTCRTVRPREIRATNNPIMGANVSHHAQ